jgi:hypothetical protein
VIYEDAVFPMSTGKGADLLADPRVRRLYLGG